MAHPKEPILFSEFNNSLTGTESRIKIPENCIQVDYEVELAWIKSGDIVTVEIEKLGRLTNHFISR